MIYTVSRTERLNRRHESFLPARRLTVPAGIMKTISMLYHYTLRFDSYLGSILRDGHIKLEANFRCPDRYRRVFPRMCWASRRADYEPTALKGVGIDARGQMILMPVAEYLPLAARIVVAPDAAPMSWATYRLHVLGQALLSRADREFAIIQLGALERAGRRSGGDPADWFCSPDPIRQTDWLGIETCDEGQWRSAVPSQAVADDCIRAFGVPA